MKKILLLIPIIVFVILGLNSGCTTSLVVTPTSTFLITPPWTPTKMPTMTKKVIPTETPQPVWTYEVIPTKTPKKPKPTSTSLPLDLTYEALPTVTNSTAVPIPDQSGFQRDLLGLGYNLSFSSSTRGPGDYIYSAYIFLDSSFRTPQSDYDTPLRNASYEDLETLEGCRIAFYRSDGQSNELIYSFAAPKYPEGSAYDHYPVLCLPNRWNSPSLFWWYGSPDSEVYELLNLNGVWSDINGNGLPEFAVLYQYCDNGCLNYGAVATHFYEIQTTSKVVDITADLPGVIEPFLMIHSKEARDFYVYDPTLWYCYKWCIIETWWIFAWNGEEFVDVTSNYVDEYIVRGEKVVAEIKEQYQKIFPEWELLTILFLFEKAGLRDQAIDIFMEISDPANWQNADSEQVCWLQVARATAMDDYKHGRPFQFPPIQLAEPVDIDYQFANLFDPDFDVANYDLSACDEFMP